LNLSTKHSTAAHRLCITVHMHIYGFFYVFLRYSVSFVSILGTPWFECNGWTVCTWFLPELYVLKETANLTVKEVHMEWTLTQVFRRLFQVKCRAARFVSCHLWGMLIRPCRLIDVDSMIDLGLGCIECLERIIYI
jgi:hypothetical protein